MKTQLIILPQGNILVSDESPFKSIPSMFYDPTDKDMEKSFIAGGKLARNLKNSSFDEIIQSLQQPKVFDVEVEVESELDAYIKRNHTQEECIGFIDGFKRANELFALYSVVVPKGTLCETCKDIVL